MRPKTSEAQESTNFLSVIMILVGIVLILVGQAYFHEGLWLKIFDSMGVLITGVFATSLLYEKFLAEKHFREFRLVLHDQLRSLETIEAKCLKLGIKDLYETRTEYQMKIPMSQLIASAEKNSEFYCVAKSLFHFLNKGAELKAGLKKGINFRLAVVDPEQTTKAMQKMMYLYPGDIGSALNALDNLLSWTLSEEYTGSLELRYHDLYLTDSCTIVETQAGHLLYWDLSFGRDLTEKKLMVLEDFTESDAMGVNTLARDLFTRYVSIYEQSVPMFRIEAGKVILDRITDHVWVPIVGDTTAIAANPEL